MAALENWNYDFMVKTHNTRVVFGSGVFYFGIAKPYPKTVRGTFLSLHYSGLDLCTMIWRDHQVLWRKLMKGLAFMRRLGTVKQPLHGAFSSFLVRSAFARSSNFDIWR